MKHETAEKKMPPKVSAQFAKTRAPQDVHLDPINEYQCAEATRALTEVTNAVTWKRRHIEGKMRSEPMMLNPDALTSIIGPHDGAHCKICRALRDRLGWDGDAFDANKIRVIPDPKKLVSSIA